MWDGNTKEDRVSREEGPRGEDPIAVCVSREGRQGYEDVTQRYLCHKSASTFPNR